MSLQALNSPPLIAVAGAAVLSAIPSLQAVGFSLGSLQLLNAAAFATNVAAVSVPGRIDGQQDAEMRKEVLNPAEPGSGNTSSKDNESCSTFSDVYSASRGRTLVSPAGWAFAIWGPIYLGEAAFCLGQFSVQPLQTVLPQISAPFIAANLCQSLWCASFRPSYNKGWAKYVSAAMLGGTAVALSQVHAAVPPGLAGYFVPLTMHFGWATAATLVNLNGCVAMSDVSDTFVIATGHASALAATALGVGVTLTQGSPVYGLTIAWALAACANGMKQRETKTPLQKGMMVQRTLCMAGSTLCAAVATGSFFF
ncbi:predicted protein [Phaeodactylum tricornutum CCAP 1055/1]|jgi:hypothetical protein|uniref:Uncharacterized protein n=2 Tax=Phaeodactylum tricornutum TaxID=2850 RepID=B7FPJ2_PHATC|nr:predicted protein [Phaeodactylum tricornutum CCAP 1055/1]EEC51684.1 predicted protein [Phaeodactylum tricornutum CCAP 1055/1]|eukprot:XP_002177221.1 predicted protein [Phaeodactylum tricornutum CCAP 1055/1]